jgi:hypothetical protein
MAAARALHRRALRVNWDEGIWRLQRMVEDPACDHGTALAIYWMGGPGFDQQYATAKEVDSWRKLTYRFLRQLEKRLLRKQFATSNILFNPRFDCTSISSEGHDWTAEYDDIPKRRPIPDALKEPSCRDPAWEARGRAPIANTANRLT